MYKSRHDYLCQRYTWGFRSYANGRPIYVVTHRSILYTQMFATSPLYNIVFRSIVMEKKGGIHKRRALQENFNKLK
jgi:hypothetical protein